MVLQGNRAWRLAPLLLMLACSPAVPVAGADSADTVLAVADAAAVADTPDAVDTLDAAETVDAVDTFDAVDTLDAVETADAGDTSAPDVPIVLDDLVPAGLGSALCQVAGDLPQPTGIQLVPWFTQLGLQQPIHLTALPDGGDRMVAVLRPGQIVVFDNQPDVKVKTVMLDIQPLVSTAGEGGLLSVAFHPQFKKNHKFYVNYTTAGPVMNTVIVEYTTKLADPDVADPASARTLLTIQQPFSNHNGGQVFFDKSGMLLIGMGDGGSGGDPFKNGQNPKALLGKMLRIDVDNKAPGLQYAIPKDNPFVGNPAYSPEILALGMRNPWRFSVDRLTGAIWAADVGQGAFEEIDIIESAKNYGWNKMEGAHCYNASTCDQTGLTLPVAEYSHALGTSVTGGYVYRGSQNKSLYGKYIFADFGSGRFWALAAQGAGWQLVEVAQSQLSPVTFGEDRDGELYVAQLFGGQGTVFKVVEKTTQPPVGSALPLLLSQTQCFASLKPLLAAPGLLPYQVAAPLWSDGAGKKRWLVLAKGMTQLPAPPEDDIAAWNLPLGTLLIKHFALGPQDQVPVETRFMRRDANGWSFFTYRWNPDGSDAELQPGGGTTTSYAVAGATQTWHVPTMTECATCHKATADGPQTQVLGVHTAQLHREVATAQGLAIDQLLAWRMAGLLPAAFQPAEHLALPVATANLPPPSEVAGQARAFLHANCSHCHRPGGAAPAQIDLRYTTQLKAMQACGIPPQNGDVGGAAQAILAPGKPEQSALWLRMAAPPGGPWFMPPIAVSVPPPGAAELVNSWIASLAACQ